MLNDVELVQGKVDPDEVAALAGKLNGLKVSAEIRSVWSEEVKRLVGAGKLKEGDARDACIECVGVRVPAFLFLLPC